MKFNLTFVKDFAAQVSIFPQFGESVVKCHSFSRQFQRVQFNPASYSDIFLSPEIEGEEDEKANFGESNQMSDSRCCLNFPQNISLVQIVKAFLSN